MQRLCASLLVLGLAALLFLALPPAVLSAEELSVTIIADPIVHLGESTVFWVNIRPVNATKFMCVNCTISTPHSNVFFAADGNPTVSWTHDSFAYPPPREKRFFVKPICFAPLVAEVEVTANCTATPPPPPPSSPPPPPPSSPPPPPSPIHGNDTTSFTVFSPISLDVGVAAAPTEVDVQSEARPNVAVTVTLSNKGSLLAAERPACNVTYDSTHFDVSASTQNPITSVQQRYQNDGDPIGPPTKENITCALQPGNSGGGVSTVKTISCNLPDMDQASEGDLPLWDVTNFTVPFTFVKSLPTIPAVTTFNVSCTAELLCGTAFAPHPAQVSLVAPKKGISLALKNVTGNGVSKKTGTGEEAKDRYVAHAGAYVEINAELANHEADSIECTLPLVSEELLFFETKLPDGDANLAPTCRPQDPSSRGADSNDDDNYKEDDKKKRANAGKTIVCTMDAGKVPQDGVPKPLTIGVRTESGAQSHDKYAFALVCAGKKGNNTAFRQSANFSLDIDREVALVAAQEASYDKTKAKLLLHGTVRNTGMSDDEKVACEISWDDGAVGPVKKISSYANNSANCQAPKDHARSLCQVALKGAPVVPTNAERWNEAGAYFNHTLALAKPKAGTVARITMCCHSDIVTQPACDTVEATIEAGKSDSDGDGNQSFNWQMFFALAVIVLIGLVVGVGMWWRRNAMSRGEEAAQRMDRFSEMEMASTERLSKGD